MALLLQMHFSPVVTAAVVIDVDVGFFSIVDCCFVEGQPFTGRFLLRFEAIGELSLKVDR